MSPDPVSAGFDFAKELLAVVGKIMDKIPNYSQRKKEKFHSLLERYEISLSRDYSQRDDNQIGIAKAELERFLRVFSTEIDTKLKVEWQEEEKEE